MWWFTYVKWVIAILILAWLFYQIFKPAEYQDKTAPNGSVFRVYSNGTVHILSTDRRGTISEHELSKDGQHWVEYPRWGKGPISPSVAEFLADEIRHANLVTTFTRAIFWIFIILIFAGIGIIAVQFIL